MQAPEEMVRVAYHVPLGLAVLSPYYCANRWPMRELQIFYEQAKRNELVLLPLFLQARLPEILQKCIHSALHCLCVHVPQVL